MEREKLIAETKKELAPVIGDLRNAGYDVQSLDELRQSGLKYEAATPILLYWLPRVGLSDAKESIVRALSVPWAKPDAGPLLISEFRKTPKDREGLRWAIGNALEVVVERSLLEPIIEIVCDNENGTSREMFVLALGKIRDPRSIEVLIKLLDDEQVSGHAIMALRKLKAPQALDHLARFANHPKTWVKNEAKKAITAILRHAARP